MKVHDIRVTIIAVNSKSLLSGQYYNIWAVLTNAKSISSHTYVTTALYLTVMNTPWQNHTKNQTLHTRHWHAILHITGLYFCQAQSCGDEIAQSNVFRVKVLTPPVLPTCVVAGNGHVRTFDSQSYSFGSVLNWNLKPHFEMQFTVVKILCWIFLSTRFWRVLGQWFSEKFSCHSFCLGQKD